MTSGATGLPPAAFGASLDEVRAFYDAHTDLFVEFAGATIQGGLVQHPQTGREIPAWSNRHLADRAGIRPMDRVLDAGCGVCGPALDIAAALPDVRIDGVTISPRQADIARDRVADAGQQDRVRVHVADYHAVPFADDSFDFVYSYAVFQHIPDRDVVFGYFQEARRVLKEGGIARFQNE